MVGSSPADPVDRLPRVQSVDRAMLLLRAVAVADPEDSTAARLAEEVRRARQPRRARRPGLERLSLQTGETVGLAVWQQGELTYVDEVVPPAIVAATWLGRTVPLHATSTGKVLMAFGDLPAMPFPGRRRLERFTDTTVTSRAALEEQLAQVRLRGFSTCRGELEDSAWGVSAPVKDRAGRLVAVLSVWGPGTRITDARPRGAGTAGARARVDAARGPAIGRLRLRRVSRARGRRARPPRTGWWSAAR